MKIFLPLCVLLLSYQAVANEGDMALTAAQWVQPRDAGAVIRIMPVAEAVRALNRQTGPSQLVLRYPQGEAGSQWAQELHDWLVSLGISSDRLLLLPAGIKHRIEFEIRTLVQIN